MSKKNDGVDSQGKVAEAIKLIFERASTRIAALAGELASRRQKCRDEGIHSKALVTITHKSNVLCQKDGLIRESSQAVLSKYYYAVAVEEQIADSMAY